VGRVGCGAPRRRCLLGRRRRRGPWIDAPRRLAPPRPRGSGASSARGRGGRRRPDNSLCARGTSGVPAGEPARVAHQGGGGRGAHRRGEGTLHGAGSEPRSARPAGPLGATPRRVSVPAPGLGGSGLARQSFVSNRPSARRDPDHGNRRPSSSCAGDRSGSSRLRGLREHHPPRPRRVRWAGCPSRRRPVAWLGRVGR